eukprot:6478397-Amphidinium_carterae.1
MGAFPFSVKIVSASEEVGFERCCIATNSVHRLKRLLVRQALSSRVPCARLLMSALRSCSASKSDPVLDVDHVQRLSEYNDVVLLLDFSKTSIANYREINTTCITRGFKYQEIDLQMRTLLFSSSKYLFLLEWTVPKISLVFCGSHGLVKHAPFTVTWARGFYHVGVSLPDIGPDASRQVCTK